MYLCIPPMYVCCCCCRSVSILLCCCAAACAAVRHRAPDNKICCCDPVHLIPVIFLLIQKRFMFYVPLDVLYSTYLINTYTSSVITGNARSQGGRQPTAAKPPLYIVVFLLLYAHATCRNCEFGGLFGFPSRVVSFLCLQQPGTYRYTVSSTVVSSTVSSTVSSLVLSVVMRMLVQP